MIRAVPYARAKICLVFPAKAQTRCKTGRGIAECHGETLCMKEHNGMAVTEIFTRA